MHRLASEARCETGYRSTLRSRAASGVGPRLRMPRPFFLVVCDPTCGFALPRLLLASPTHVALSISRPIAEFEHVFSFASGFIRADLHKHDTVQSSNNNHKILWSV